MAQPKEHSRPADHALAILTSYFALVRNINPTSSISLYRNAPAIFPDHDPARWHPDDVQALANLNCILATGLDIFPTIIAENNAGDLSQGLRWLVIHLAYVEIPAAVYHLPEWAAFTHALDDRLLGVALPARQEPRNSTNIIRLSTYRPRNVHPDVATHSVG